MYEDYKCFAKCFDDTQKKYQMRNKIGGLRRYLRRNIEEKEINNRTLIL